MRSDISILHSRIFPVWCSQLVIFVENQSSSTTDCLLAVDLMESKKLQAVQIVSTFDTTHREQ